MGDVRNDNNVFTVESSCFDVVMLVLSFFLIRVCMMDVDSGVDVVDVDVDVVVV